MPLPPAFVYTWSNSSFTIVPASGPPVPRPCCALMSASSLARNTRSSCVSLAGFHGSSISPRLNRSYCVVHTSRLISSRIAFCSARYFASFAGSRVPIVPVPLNIMCSKKWLMPVIPGRSSTLPTFATHPALTTLGWSVRGTRRNCIPLGSENSSTATCWAGDARPARTIAAARAAHSVGRRSMGRFLGGRFLTTPTLYR